MNFAELRLGFSDEEEVRRCASLSGAGLEVALRRSSLSEGLVLGDV